MTVHKFKKKIKNYMFRIREQTTNVFFERIHAYYVQKSGSDKNEMKLVKLI